MCVISSKPSSWKFKLLTCFGFNLNWKQLIDSLYCLLDKFVFTYFLKLICDDVSC